MWSPFFVLSMNLNRTPESFEQLLAGHLGLTPTDGQKKLFYVFTRFVFSGKPRCALLIRGYAGTGKTTSVSAMVRALQESGINSILLAPTGRAAKVLAGYSGSTASTIHRQIYIRKSDRSGRTWFELKENEARHTVFFVDEASMIGGETFAAGSDELGSGDLLDDLITHVYSGEGCRLVFIGDDAQLPPVGSDRSPALEIELLRDRFHLHIAGIELSEVIRQKQGSGILDNATLMRSQIAAGLDNFPSVYLDNYPDIVHVEGDVQPYVEEALALFGSENVVILTRSNKRANLFNQQMRARILSHEEEINSGDRMMVLKNNYFWLDDLAARQIGFIANGDIIHIIRVRSFIDRGAFRFCRAVIRLADYSDIVEMEVILLCNSIWDESASLSGAKLRELWNEIALDYADEPSAVKRRKAIFEDPFYNALQVKFAYAITVHKAQGGQWPCVFVDQGYIQDDMKGPELNRWFYTAFTRAQHKLFLVGFDERIIVRGAIPGGEEHVQENP
jgi:exodeoxyribonuclease V